MFFEYLQNNTKLDIWVTLCQMKCDAFVIKKFSTAWCFFAMISIREIYQNFACEICSKHEKIEYAFMEIILCGTSIREELFTLRLKGNHIVACVWNTQDTKLTHFERGFRRLSVYVHAYCTVMVNRQTVYPWWAVRQCIHLALGSYFKWIC